MPAPRDLTRAMLKFGGVLRASGLPVTTPEVMDGVPAREGIHLENRDEVYLALRAVLVSRVEELPAFDRCFENFWRFQAEEGQGLDGLVPNVPPSLAGDEHGGESPPAAAEKQAQVAVGDREGREASDRGRVR